MDKRFLVLAGCVTDQCVAHAAKDAADLGYLVTIVTGVSLLTDTDLLYTLSQLLHVRHCQMSDSAVSYLVVSLH
jgi:nicotinamidase-related amidase